MAEMLNTLLKALLAILLLGNLMGMGLQLRLGIAPAAVDEHAIVMVALEVALQTIAAFIAARAFGAQAEGSRW
jgi:hypothetical protein